MGRMRSELTRQLTGDEGVKAHAYQDHLGYEIVKTVAAIQIEQASAKVLAPTNTNTGNL